MGEVSIWISRLGSKKNINAYERVKKRLSEFEKNNIFRMGRICEYNNGFEYYVKLPNFKYEKEQCGYLQIEYRLERKGVKGSCTLYKTNVYVFRECGAYEYTLKHNTIGEIFNSFSMYNLPSVKQYDFYGSRFGSKYFVWMSDRYKNEYTDSPYDIRDIDRGPCYISDLCVFWYFGCADNRLRLNFQLVFSITPEEFMKNVLYLNLLYLDRKYEAFIFFLNTITNSSTTLDESSFKFNLRAEDIKCVIDKQILLYSRMKKVKVIKI